MKMMSSKSVAESQSGANLEMAELKSMLKEVIAENKRLQEQIKRQEQVWFALEQMCEALNQVPPEMSSNVSGQPDPADKANLNKSSPSAGESAIRIQILSITTEVLDPEATKITVEYSAQGIPAVEWLAILEHDALYRTSGLTIHGREKDTYISSLTLDYYIMSSRRLSFRVYVTSDSAWVTFNLSAILNSASQTIVPISMIMDKLQNPTAASSEDNYIDFTLSGSFSKFKDVYAYFTGLNMSVSPPQMYEIYSNEENLNVTVSNMSATKTKVTVDIGKNAENGGVLTLHLDRMAEQPGLFKYIAYGRSFDISTNDGYTVIPLGSMGLYPLPNITVFYPPYQSITCGAMGNPRPEVKLERDSSAGVKDLLQEKTELFDEWTVIKAFTIYANDSKLQGKYICRASNAHAVVKSVTELIVHEEVRIDPYLTGLKLNTSNKIELSGQASGKPIPRLELRLFNEHGPDLAQSSRYKADKSAINPTTAMLTVTLSPVDTDIVKADKSAINPTTAMLTVTLSPVDTDIVKVYCAAYNTERYDSKTSLIQIFPDPSDGMYYWDLYHELQNKQADMA